MSGRLRGRPSTCLARVPVLPWRLPTWPIYGLFLCHNASGKLPCGHFAIHSLVCCFRCDFFWADTAFPRGKASHVRCSFALSTHRTNRFWSLVAGWYINRCKTLLSFDVGLFPWLAGFNWRGRACWLLCWTLAQSAGVTASDAHAHRTSAAPKGNCSVARALSRRRFAKAFSWWARPDKISCVSFFLRFLRSCTRRTDYEFVIYVFLFISKFLFIFSSSSALSMHMFLFFFLFSRFCSQIFEIFVHGFCSQILFPDFCSSILFSNFCSWIFIPRFLFLDFCS
jgi:hypothetical protein